MAGRGKTIAGQFDGRLIEMLESPAYRELSLSAHRVLSRLAIELGHHGGCDNGRLPVTYGHFMEYGIDRAAIAPAIRELEALGFIEVTERGRAGPGEFRAPSFYRLTYPVVRKGNPPTNEWRQIKTIEGAEAIARAARKVRARRQRQVIHQDQKRNGRAAS
jgi:hypothetical protein